METVATDIEQPDWHDALKDLQQARTIFILGATDAGKTTFLTWLANALRTQGRQVAIVDADVGQSTLGPPTTIGLGIIAQPFQNLEELTPAALYFVGSISPRGHLLPMVAGTKRMIDYAHKLAVDHIILDTCGYVEADGGQALKQHQIELTRPDRVVSLQHADECEPILRSFRYCQRPRLIRLRASPACRRRGTEERRLHRERMFQQYFSKPKAMMLAWDDLNLIAAPVGAGTAFEVKHDLLQLGIVKRTEILWAERHDGELSVIIPLPLTPNAVAALERAVGVRVRTWIAKELRGTLLGLLDETGETLGIGVLQHIHFTARRFEILTAEGLEEIRGIQWSRTRMEAGGQLRRAPVAAL